MTGQSEHNSILNIGIISTIFFKLLKKVHNNPTSRLSTSGGRLQKNIENGPFLMGYLGCASHL